MSEKIYLAVLSFLFGISFILFLQGADAHEKAIIKAGEHYEICVMETYGVSPAYWYSQKGSYPYCGE